MPAKDATITAKFVDLHTHNVCGDAACAATHPAHTERNYLPWDGTRTLSFTTGEYGFYLENDVTATGISVSGDAVLYLCLNGKDLKGTSSGSTISVAGNAKLVLCDCVGTGIGDWGTITNNAGGRGITVGDTYTTGTVTYPSVEMYGGNVTGIVREHEFDECGAGVYISDGGSFTLYNGGITNNTSEYIEYAVTITASPADGGTFTGAGNYEDGTEATLTAIANVGYTFAGWEKDGSMVNTGAEYTFVVTEDCALVAVFNPEQHTITFADTGDSTIPPIVQDYGTAVAAPADPTRTGYTFTGWDKTIPATMPAGDMTITAQWAANMGEMELYSVYGVVHYQQQADGTYAEVTADTQFPLQAKIGSTVSAEPKQYTGYTFNPEKSVASATLVRAEAGADGVPVYTVLELYYDLCSFTVTLTTDGNGTAAAAPAAGNTGDAVTLTASANTGYRFKEWQVVSGGVIINADSFVIGSENVVIKAVFEELAPAVYTVAFNANGGEGSMAPQTFAAGDALPLTTVAFTRTGYAFAGWNTAADGSGTAFADGETVAVYADIVLYAQWQADTAADPDANPLQITKQPAERFAEPGKTAQFTVSASGDGLMYQWYIDRNDGSGWVLLRGATGASHTTSPVEAAFDGFRYCCDVRDSRGETVRTGVAVLHVVIRPDVPQTGDSANPGLLLMLFVISGAGCLLLLKNRRRATN